MQKNLWIGTNDGGLNLYNPATQRFTSYTLQEDENTRGIGSNNIKAVYVDEKKSLVYIGTHAGGLSIQSSVISAYPQILVFIFDNTTYYIVA